MNIKTEIDQTRTGAPSAVISLQGTAPLTEIATELATVLHNLRFYTKYWNLHGGGEARERVRYWQERADKLLDRLGLLAHNNMQSIKIIPGA